MSRAICASTKERAHLRALRASGAPGLWRAGNAEAEGKVWVHDPNALGGPVLGERCVFIANMHFPHTANRRLVAAAVNAVVPLCDALDATERELAAAREEIILARVGGVFAAFAGQSSREADAIQWGAMVGERDALRAENAALRERVAALEVLVGIVP